MAPHNNQGAARPLQHSNNARAPRVAAAAKKQTHPIQSGGGTRQCADCSPSCAPHSAAAFDQKQWKASNNRTRLNAIIMFSNKLKSDARKSRENLHPSCITCIAARSLALMAATMASAFQQSFLHLMHTRTGLRYSCTHANEIPAKTIAFKLAGAHQLGDGPLFTRAVVAEDLAAHSAKASQFDDRSLTIEVVGRLTCSGACV